MNSAGLLNPRIKVIALTPANCQVIKIGDVIEMQDDCFTISEPGEENSPWPIECISLELIGLFSHLFKPLEWWEERTPEQMPAYVKELNGVRVFKLIEYQPGNIFVKVGYFHKKKCQIKYNSLRHLIPATEADFNFYNNCYLEKTNYV